MRNHCRGLAGILTPLPVLALAFWLAIPQDLGATSRAIPTPWSELVDSDALKFEDPFRALDRDTLKQLRNYAALSKRIRDENVGKDDRLRLQERLVVSKNTLTALNVDPDWLLSQRWVVAKRRHAAAETGNHDLDGKFIAMIGFFIPAMTSADGSSIGYLVEKPGLCSHLPPPPPNKLIRLVVPAGTAKFKLYDQVRVNGTMVLSKTTQRVFVRDGTTRMRSTWTMQVEALWPVTAGLGNLRPRFNSITARSLSGG